MNTHIHETVGKRIELTFSDMNSGESFIDSAESHTVDNLGLYNTGAWQLRDVEDGTVYYIFDREIHDGSIKVIGDTPERKTFVYYETYTESRHIAVELDADATEEQIRNAAYAFKSDEWEGDSYEVTDTEIKDADGNLVKFEAE